MQHPGTESGLDIWAMKFQGVDGLTWGSGNSHLAGGCKGQGHLRDACATTCCCFGSMACSCANKWAGCSRHTRTHTLTRPLTPPLPCCTWPWLSSGVRREAVQGAGRGAATRAAGVLGCLHPRGAAVDAQRVADAVGGAKRRGRCHGRALPAAVHPLHLPQHRNRREWCAVLGRGLVVSNV